MRSLKIALFIMLVIISLTACSSNFMQTVVGTSDTKSKKDYAGKVNDHIVTEEEYVRSYIGHYEGFSMRTNRKPSDEEKRQIYIETWDDIVKHFVLIDLFEKHNITTTMPEVLDTLLTNIPRIIRESPVFEYEGEFDYQFYEKCLREDAPVDLSWLKLDYYKYKIPLKKLKAKAIVASDMNPEELKENYNFYYSSIDAKIVYLNPMNTRAVVINAEIDDYYNKNIKKYFIPASCDITYVTFPVDATAEDMEAARYTADSLFVELNKGAVFSFLAKENSMHSSKSDDGALGFIRFTDLPGNVSAAIKKTPVSGFTRPIKEGDDWSIYLVEDKTQNMVKLRLIRIKPKAGEKAYALIDEKMRNVEELSKSIGLKAAVKEYNMAVEEVKGLSEENDVIPNLGKSTTLIKQMMRKNSGAILDPIKHQNQKAFVLVEVTESRASSYVPVESVKKEIEEIILRDKKFSMTMDEATRLVDGFKGDKMIETAVRAGYEIIDLPKLTYESTVHNINSTSLVLDIINLKSDGMSTRPVALEDGVYIGYAQKINRPNPKDLNLVRRELFEKLSSEENDRFFDNWLKSKISKAKVHIWFNDPAFNPK